MYEEEYVKDNPIIEKTEEQRDLELIQSVIKTRKELEIANHNFEFAEAELIDYYTYQIKANQAKLDYLLKKVKRRGLMIERKGKEQLFIDRKNEVG